MLASKQLLGCLLRSTAHIRNSLDRSASSWQIMAGAILERPATLVVPFSPLQKAYLDMLTELEAEHSLLSDHELKALEEKKALAKATKSAGAAATRIKLADDLVNEWKAELEAFKKRYHCKPQTDHKLDDINRHTDKALTLLVLQKIGDKEHWLFPIVDNKENETLRQTAERAILECFGDSMSIKTLGNAPVAFYKYKYPKAVQEKTRKEGAKVFYIKMNYISGMPKLKTEFGSKIIWSTYDEMLERLPPIVKKAVKPSFFVTPNIDFTLFLDAIAQKDELRKRHLIKE
ncbi:39S ribosomal protein L46, mitochondrial-like isoform X1 [Varroa jacobsoni]|uniref:39S ribosomal protein L46, mitochondrial-like isoform X1 n=2 Tax=Varroa jacobsoni TaxID=62625 RepID=UPI000BFAAA8A|nr:39S ribosomal protein L46, mitochondrial-like isoform X1 [Varroa jacobsoni]